MQEYRLFLTCIFPYKDTNENIVLVRENRGYRKPVTWHILHSAKTKQVQKIYHEINRNDDIYYENNFRK